MKKISMFFYFTLTFTTLVFGQIAQDKELDFEVNKIYPPISITKSNLIKSSSLVDINKYFKPTWVKEYISVKTFATHLGHQKVIETKNATISAEQKELLLMADEGTVMEVNILYIPENTLKHNDPKEIKFTFQLDPLKDAEFIDGREKLRAYLKENAIDKIPDGEIINYDLVALKFTINEKGQIVNAHFFESSMNADIDDLLMKTICNMPVWAPAEFSDGLKVSQEFVFTVGNMANCIVPLLNIRSLE